MANDKTTPVFPPRPPIQITPWWAKKLLDAIFAVAGEGNVSHAGRMQSTRYFVWDEDGGEDYIADNRHVEPAVRGYLDLFTEIELDHWAMEVGPALDEAGISWEWTGTTYEPNTGLWHHSWSWTAV